MRFLSVTLTHVLSYLNKIMCFSWFGFRESGGRTWTVDMHCLLQSLFHDGYAPVINHSAITSKRENSYDVLCSAGIRLGKALVVICSISSS